MSGYLTITEARDSLRRATAVVLSLEKAYAGAVEAAADAEGVYRAELGRAFERYRTDGKGVEESTTLARRDVVVHSRERDVRAGMLKLAAEQLENGRDTRRALWRIVEWSREHDARQNSNGQVADERAPGERWP